MAFAWSAALNPTQIYRQQHGNRCKDVQALSFVQEQQIQYGIRKRRQKGIRPKLKGRIILRASVGETVDDKGTELSKEENALKKGDQADAAESPSLSPSSPFVGGKISSRIAARVADTTNGRSTATAATPSTFTKTPSSQGIPTPNSLGKPTFTPKPLGSQSFSPKPPSPQGSPFSSPLAGAGKLNAAKPSVFLDKRAGEFKQPGPKSLMDTLRQSDGSKTTKFGQPIVPTNLFDEPEKLTAEGKKFEFTLNAGQLVLIFSFVTIISIMLGTAFLVWKVGGIHYNEF